jgi:hypothetical protein
MQHAQQLQQRRGTIDAATCVSCNSSRRAVGIWEHASCMHACGCAYIRVVIIIIIIIIIMMMMMMIIINPCKPYLTASAPHTCHVRNVNISWQADVWHVRVSSAADV